MPIIASGTNNCNNSVTIIAIINDSLVYPVMHQPYFESIFPFLWGSLGYFISKLGSDYWLLLVLPPIIGNYWLLLQLLAIIGHYFFAKSFHIIGYYCDRLHDRDRYTSFKL